MNGVAPEPMLPAVVADVVADAPAQRQLPFAFAQHHGVLLDLGIAADRETGDGPLPVFYRPGLRVDPP